MKNEENEEYKLPFWEFPTALQTSYNNLPKLNLNKFKKALQEELKIKQQEKKILKLTNNPNFKFNRIGAFNNSNGRAVLSPISLALMNAVNNGPTATQIATINPFSKRLVTASEDYIDKLRSIYNNRSADDLILHDLRLDFDLELEDAKKHYKKDNLTVLELDNWFGGKKYFGKELREGEQEIYPGIYLWHGRTFIGDYRDPVSSKGIRVKDGLGSIIEVTDFGTTKNSRITKGSNMEIMVSPEDKRDLDKNYAFIARELNKDEWKNYIKDVFLKLRGALEGDDIAAVYSALYVGKWDSRSSQLLQKMSGFSNRLKQLYDSGEMPRDLNGLKGVILYNYRTVFGDDIIHNMVRLKILPLERAYHKKELSYESFKQATEEIYKEENELKKHYPNNADAIRAFLNPLNSYDANLALAVTTSIIQSYTTGLVQYRRALVKSLNNTSIHNDNTGAMQYLEAESSEKLHNDVKIADQKNDEVLKVSLVPDNVILSGVFGSPRDVKTLQEIDDQLLTATNQISSINYDLIKNNASELFRLSQDGDRIAKSMSGYDGDSDDILHLILEEHGIDAPNGYLDNDLRIKALALYSLDHQALCFLNSDPAEVQRQMLANMLHYRYAALGWQEWCGATVWGLFKDFGGGAALIAGWILSVPLRFWYDSFSDAYANSWLAQWGQNFLSSGITGFEALFSHGFSPLEGQKIAKEGRAYTEEEISGYLKAGVIDAETAEAMREGTLRTGGGETFGVLIDESESAAESGGLTLNTLSSMTSSAITMFGLMKAVLGITKALSGFGRGLYKTGAAIQAAGNVLKTGSAARQTALYIAGGAFKIAGNLLTAAAPYIAAVGLNSGYAFSSYLTHMQDALSLVYTDFKDQILGAPTEKFKAMVDGNPKNKYGGMNSKLYAAYLEKISEREQDRLIDEIEGGLRGTAFLKDPTLKDPNDPLSANFSTKNIDTTKVKNYVDDKIAENREYIYAMDKFMQKAKEAASNAANIEFAIVSTVDGTAMKALLPSLYMTRTQTLAMRAAKRQLASTASKILNKAGNLVEKIPSKRISSAAKLIKNKLSPTSLSLNKKTRSVGEITVDSKGNVKKVTSTAEDPRKQIGHENLNNFLFGFSSNYAQDIGVGVDKGLYNNEIANYIKNVYSPQSIISLMGPVSPEARDGYLGEAMAGLEGGLEAAKEWTSFRDGFIGAVAGFITPNFKLGDAKYIDKNLTVKLKIANGWSKIKGMSVENSYTTWAKATWLDEFRKKTGYKVSWLGSSKTALYKRVEDGNLFKIEAAKRVLAVLQQRGLGVLSSINQLRQAVKDAKLSKEDQIKLINNKYLTILENAGIKISEPVLENLQDQLLLSELILDMANADFVDENGKVINNGKNPVADLYKLYIRNKSTRGQVTKERILGILNALLKGKQEGKNPVKEIFKDDLEALSILEDLLLFAETLEGIPGNPFDYLTDCFSNEKELKADPSNKNQRMIPIADEATSFVNETTKNALTLNSTVEYYRNGIESAKLELGDLFVNDPLVIRAHAKQLATLDIILDNLIKLKKEKKEIEKKIKAKYKDILDSNGKLNAKEELTYALIQQGFDDSAIAEAIKNEEAVIATIDAQIHSTQNDLESLIKQVQEQFGKKKKSSKKPRQEKEEAPKKIGFFEAMSLLDEVIKKEKKDYEKRKSEAIQNQDDIKIGEAYNVAKQLKEDLTDTFRKIENLLKYGFEEITNEEGKLIVERDKLESLKSKKERLSNLQDLHEELLKIKKGEEESNVLSEGKVSEEKKLKDYVLSTGLILRELLSNNPNREMLSLITTLLLEKQLIIDGEADIHSNHTMGKQMELLENTLGDDLLLLKDLLGKDLSINNASTQYEIQKDKIVDTTRNRFSIDSFAAEARELGIVDTLAIGYKDFASECKTYTEFINAYDAEQLRIITETEEANLDVDDETAKKNQRMAYFRARALDKALSENKFFIQYKNRANLLVNHILFKAVRSLASNLDTKYKNTVADNEVSKSYLAIKEEVERLKGETNLTEGLIQLILRNIVEHLCLRTEDGVPNDLDSIQSAILKMNDDTEAISNKVLDSINKLLEALNVLVDANTISKISSLLFQLFEVLKAELAAAKNLASLESGDIPIEEVLGKEEGKGEENGPVSPQRNLASFDGEKGYKTIIAQISSYVSHIGDILSVINDIKKLKDSLGDEKYQKQMTVAKQQLNGLAQVLISKAGLFTNETIESVHQKILSMDSDEILFLYNTLTEIINTPYSKDIDLPLIIDNIVTEAIENGKSADSIAVNFLLSLSDTINLKYNIPILYDNALSTPLEQQLAKRKASVDLSVICMNPFKLSTFYRKLGGEFMRELMNEHGVDKWLAQNTENLAGKEVIFLYNQLVWKLLLELEPNLLGAEGKSVVAVAVKDPNGSVTVHTKDSAGETVSENYLIIGFLPTDTTLNTKETHRNSAGNVRKHINRSIEKHSEIASTSSEDVWIPIYDFSSEKEGLMTTTIKKTDAVSYDKNGSGKEEDVAKADHENTKKVREELTLKSGGKAMPTGIFSNDGSGSMKVNVGTKAAPVKVPVKKPHMDSVINSEGHQFSEVKSEHKKERTPKSAKALINFNKKTLKFSELIKGLLLAVARNPTTPSDVLTALIGGKHPLSGEKLVYGLIEGYEDFHARNSNKGICLSNNIFCHGGHMYKCKIDGDHLDLFVTDVLGNLVEGTTVRFDLNSIDEQGTNFKDGKEEEINKVIADFIIALSEKDNAVEIADFTVPLSSMTKSNPAPIEKANIEEAFDDGIVVIPEYGATADVTINPIQEKGSVKLVNTEAERKARDVVNRNTEVRNIDEDAKKTIALGINAITRLYKGDPRPRTIFNQQTLRNKRNLGASTENVNLGNEGSKKSNLVIMAFMLGNIVDDMAKKLASGMECKYSDYSTILTEEEYTHLLAMINNGLKTFMRINQFTPLMLYENGSPLKNALEVVVKDLTLIDECIKLGISSKDVSRNFMDLVMITPRGTLAIIDVKSHVGDEVAPEHLSAYVNLLNMYAKLLNDAIMRLRRSGVSFPAQCIVDEIYLFEVPLASRSGINYSQEFDIRQFNREGDGEEMVEFTRKLGSTIKLVNENDAAHLTKYTIFKDEILENIILKRRKDAIKQLTKDREQGREEKEKLKKEIISKYVNSEKLLYNKDEANEYFGILKVTETDGKYEITITTDAGIYQHITSTTVDKLLQYILNAENNFEIRDKPEEPPKPADTRPCEDKLIEEGGACGWLPDGAPKAGTFDKELDSVMEDIEPD